VNDLEVLPFAPFITGISFAFTFHVCWISLLLLLYYYYFYFYYYPQYLLYAGYLHLYSWDKPCP